MSTYLYENFSNEREGITAGRFFKKYLQLAGSGIFVNSFHLHVEFLNIEFFSLSQEERVLSVDFLDDGESHVTDRVAGKVEMVAGGLA